MDWLPSLLLALAVSAGPSAAINVLVVSTVSSPSHSLWAGVIADGLLQRGHSVTELVIRPPKVGHPNRTSFVVTGNVFAEEHGWDLDETFGKGRAWLEEVVRFDNFCRESTQFALQSDAFAGLVQHLREKQPHFDVFILDYFMQEPLIGLSSLIGRPPVVAITAYNLPETVLALMGSPFLSAVIPHHYTGVGSNDGEPMTFKERAVNLIRWGLFKANDYWSYRPYVEETISKVFPGSPPLSELERDVAVALVNTSPALHGAFPLVPGIVEVGGLHARPAKELPKDLRDWVDAKSAPHGFVFMSFGTNVKSAMMSKERRGAVLRAFGRIKQRVLWKYEKDDIQDELPPNVRVGNWLPQNDLLGHPNIRCFVSHNGALSTQEASYHGVPILGVPFMVDQLGYAEKVEKMGLGRRLAYTNITENNFLETLTDVINNPRYRDNMQRVKASLRDQKETPLERALWWIEYAARSNGAPHLRAPALKLAWYELWMLDVLAAMLAAAVFALWLLIRVVGLLMGSAPKRKAKQL